MMSTMQSFIITAKGLEKRREFALQFCTEKQISIFDITFVDLEGETTKTKEKLSIGISDIKQMQKNLYQKPFNSSHKAVIIAHAETLTIEAQNALLKTLEEPPAHALIFLLASTKETFLPTVLSRCKIISLEEEPKELGKGEQEQYRTILEELPTYSISQRLKLAQDAGKTKDVALSWLEQIILALRAILFDQQYSNLPAMQSNALQAGVIIEQLRDFQKTHTVIKTTNVSPRFALENLLLSL